MEKEEGSCGDIPPYYPFSLTNPDSSIHERPYSQAKLLELFQAKMGFQNFSYYFIYILK